jgi:hypothetical protein
MLQIELHCFWKKKKQYRRGRAATSPTVVRGREAYTSGGTCHYEYSAVAWDNGRQAH